MSLEIERKFLLAKEGNPRDGAWPVLYEDSYIVQTYLTPREKRVTSERVRMRAPIVASGATEEWAYTHTKKVRISDGVHEEDEKKVSKNTYTRLLLRKDESMIPITKVRRVFTWAGNIFELDVFHRPHGGLILLEIELPSMKTPVELPPFLKIEREVTDNQKEFTNAALARKGRYP